MEITQERAEAVGEALKLLVEACNMVTEDELAALIQEGAVIHATAPILDPTRYRAEGGQISQGQKVLRAFKVFKQEVKGIGFFN
ncbi:hypothetical protein ES703_113493 [subsurface metagenome]